MREVAGQYVPETPVVVPVHAHYCVLCRDRWEHTDAECREPDDYVCDDCYWKEREQWP